MAKQVDLRYVVVSLEGAVIIWGLRSRRFPATGVLTDGVSFQMEVIPSDGTQNKVVEDIASPVMDKFMLLLLLICAWNLRTLSHTFKFFWFMMGTYFPGEPQGVQQLDTLVCHARLFALQLKSSLMTLGVHPSSKLWVGWTMRGDLAVSMDLLVPLKLEEMFLPFICMDCEVKTKLF